MNAMQRLLWTSGHVMSAVPVAGSLSSLDFFVLRSSFTIRPVIPFEYTTNKKLLLLVMYWIESAASGSTTSALLQSGFLKLVRTSLYLGAPACVTAYAESPYTAKPRTRLSEVWASTDHLMVFLPSSESGAVNSRISFCTVPT